MTIKVTTPTNGGDSVEFGSGITPIAAEVTGSEVSSGEGKLELKTTTGGTSTTQVSIAASGIATFTVPPAITAVQSMVQLHTSNGHGSTNTKIRRFTTTITNQGSDITYADSASLGGTFTINTNGVYAISYIDQWDAGQWFGLSLNSNQLTTNNTSITAAHRLGVVNSGAANLATMVSNTVYIASGGVVRAHTNGNTSGSNTAFVNFTITRVG